MTIKDLNRLYELIEKSKSTYDAEKGEYAIVIENVVEKIEKEDNVLTDVLVEVIILQAIERNRREGSGGSH